MIQMRSAEASKVRIIAPFQATTMGSPHLVWKWFVTKTPPSLRYLLLRHTSVCILNQIANAKKRMIKKGWSTGRVSHRCQLEAGF